MPYGTGVLDAAIAAFDEGREFRLTEPISTVTPLVIRVIAPINFIIKLQHLAGLSSTVTMLAYRSGDGVASGTFVPSAYYANNNQKAGVSYTGQVTVATGGTFVPTTPASYKDKLTTIVATATAHTSNVGAGAVAQRGLPPETYYLVFTGGGTADYNLLIEETP